MSPNEKDGYRRKEDHESESGLVHLEPGIGRRGEVVLDTKHGWPQAIVEVHRCSLEVIVDLFWDRSRSRSWVSPSSRTGIRVDQAIRMTTVSNVSEMERRERRTGLKPSWPSSASPLPSWNAKTQS